MLALFRLVVSQMPYDVLLMHKRHQQATYRFLKTLVVEKCLGIVCSVMQRCLGKQVNVMHY